MSILAQNGFTMPLRGLLRLDIVPFVFGMLFD